MKTLEQIWIELLLHVATARDLVTWAEDVLANGGELAFDTDIVELACLPVTAPRRADEAEILIRRVVARVLPNFTFRSASAEAYAHACLLGWCERLIAEEITPYQFCQVVQPIEEGFGYPKWLGDFYNQCDWVEPSYRPVDCRHLYDYAEEYVAALKAGLDPP